MDVESIVDSIVEDLALVTESGPNERKPKEEQIRCCVYAAIRPLFKVVCGERGYGSIDDGSRIECDLWARSPNLVPVWMEFKGCWSANGWNNKASEQLQHWKKDLGKLRRVSSKSVHFFFNGPRQG